MGKFFWYACSPKLIVLETRCPWIDTSLSLCIKQYVFVMHTDRDVSMQGYCLSGKVHFAEQGSQKIRRKFDTSFWDVLSPHPPFRPCSLEAWRRYDFDRNLPREAPVFVTSLALKCSHRRIKRQNGWQWLSLIF